MKALFLTPKHVLFRRGPTEMLATPEVKVVSEAENAAEVAFLKEGVDLGSPAD